MGGAAFGRAVRGANPLQMLTPHSKYSFHTQGDGKGDFVPASTSEDHRVKVRGLLLLDHPPERAGTRRSATSRKHDLVKVYKRPRRGDLRRALPTQRLPRGCLPRPTEVLGDLRADGAEPGKSVDRGGLSSNLLTARALANQVDARAGPGCQYRWSKVEAVGTARPEAYFGPRFAEATPEPKVKRKPKVPPALVPAKEVMYAPSPPLVPRGRGGTPGFASSKVDAIWPKTGFPASRGEMEGGGWGRF